MTLNMNDLYQFINQEDGYFNLSKICRKANKKYKNYTQTLTSKKLLYNIAKNYNIERLTYRINKGAGNHHINGTYGHPLVATAVARWCSIDFETIMLGWIEKWKKDNENNVKEYNEAIDNIVPDETRYNYTEKEVQRRLQDELGGDIEVRTKYGNIDLMTSIFIIEIKQFINWKHALGQILSYSVDLEVCQNKKLRVHLICDDEEVNQIEDIKPCFNKYDIELTYEIVNEEMYL